MSHLSQIRPNLFVSDWNLAHDAALLRQHNISGVINMCDGEQSRDDIKMYGKVGRRNGLPRNGIGSGGVKLYQWALTEEDYPVEARLPEKVVVGHWKSAHAAIARHRRRGENVLVHCVEGVNRSAATVVYHLMRTEQRDGDGGPAEKEEAVVAIARLLQSIRAVRPQVNVDPTFVRMLHQQHRIGPRRLQPTPAASSSSSSSFASSSSSASTASTSVQLHLPPLVFALALMMLLPVLLRGLP
jgi:Dual specificity phosphatase, catalytic domain